MSYIRPTTPTASPFATSTSYTSTGADAYSQTWVTPSNSGGRTATVEGRGIAMNACQGSLDRFYFQNGNTLPQSGRVFNQTFQSYYTSIDECIDAGTVFKLVGVSNLDTNTGRTNIIRTGF